MTGMISRASVVAAVLVVTLAGCGGGDDSDAGQPEASGAVETLPSCDETWVVGETLPADYDGCVITGNEVQVFSPGECPSGAQYATYEDRYSPSRARRSRRSRAATSSATRTSRSSPRAAEPAVAPGRSSSGGCVFDLSGGYDDCPQAPVRYGHRAG